MDAGEFLDLNDERNKVGFKVVRERLLTSKGLDTNKDAMVRPDNNIVLGVITRNHDILPYAGIMDWMVNSFMDMNIPFDLKESVLIGGGKTLYQEYVSPDFEIKSPDDRRISPLVIVNASYNGSYLHIYFGVYNWATKSGVLTGKLIDNITVRYNSSILANTISNEIKSNLDKFTSVSEVFKQLSEASYDNFMWGVIEQDDLNFTFKKEMLKDLAMRGLIELSKDTFTNADLMDEDPTDLIATINTGAEFNGMNAWEYYISLMDIATHKMRSVSSRLSSFRGISKVFSV